MAKYVVLMNWTDQGIRSVKDTVNRARTARQAFEKMGGKLGEVWWTVGQYDLVATVEAPDDETATKMSLALSMQGNVRTTTLRAFGESEMERILQPLP
jgi:uncharacterized protein with GYD domain